MKTYTNPVRLSLIGAAALALLGACATPPPYQVVAPAPGAYEPVTTSAALMEETASQVNQWGGIIPDAKPTVPVDDGGLGELSEPN